jgi:hypothetical protein
MGRSGYSLLDMSRHAARVVQGQAMIRDGLAHFSAIGLEVKNIAS